MSKILAFPGGAPAAAPERLSDGRLWELLAMYEDLGEGHPETPRYDEMRRALAELIVRRAGGYPL